jgi:hypothetical protein
MANCKMMLQLGSNSMVISMPEWLRRFSCSWVSSSALAALLLGWTISSGATGCSSSSCDRDGCNAVKMPAADNGQTSISGVVAVEYDIGDRHGCVLCPFASATLSLWPVSEPVTDNASADAIVNGGPAAIVVLASAYYQQAVEAGSYLLCVQESCVNVGVLAGYVTPVNVLQSYGFVRFDVFDPVTHARQTTVRLTTGQ